VRWRVRCWGGARVKRMAISVAVRPGPSTLPDRQACSCVFREGPLPRHLPFFCVIAPGVEPVGTGINALNSAAGRASRERGGDPRLRHPTAAALAHGYASRNRPARRAANLPKSSARFARVRLPNKRFRRSEPNSKNLRRPIIRAVSAADRAGHRPRGHNGHILSRKKTGGATASRPLRTDLGRMIFWGVGG